MRRESGLTPTTANQAAAALLGSWFACHMMHTATGDDVGMGRVIGDGGWYFHIVDMDVLPGHQRTGLGYAILGALLDHIRSTAPGSLGMASRLGPTRQTPATD